MTREHPLFTISQARRYLDRQARLVGGGRPSPDQVLLTQVQLRPAALMTQCRQALEQGAYAVIVGALDDLIDWVRWAPEMDHPELSTSLNALRSETERFAAALPAPPRVVEDRLDDVLRGLERVSALAEY